MPLIRPSWDRPRLLRAALLGACLLGGTIWFFRIDSGAGYRGPRVDGDGVYFWLYLRSAVIDRDFDFANDYRAYGNPWDYPVTKRGRRMNPATVGAALLWSPFYLAARAGVLIAARAGHAVRLDGGSRAEELAAFYGSFLYGALAIWLALRVCRRRFGDSPALAAALGTAVGGPLVFYMIVQPSYSHAPGAFVVALLIERWEASPASERGLRGWALLGALTGLAALVRPQLVICAALPASDALLLALRHLRERQPRALARLALGAALCAGGAILLFLPQMLIWRSIHGTLLTVPQGPSFMQWRAALWSEALFHPRAGLIPWMPLALPALLGLALLVRREPRFAAPLLALFALLTLVNGACWDWWGGYAFGARRFTEAYVLLAVGLAAALAGLGRWLRARSERLPAALLVLALVALCLLNLRMLVSFRRAGVDWYGHRRFHEVYLDALKRISTDVHDTVGNPLSFPANVAFALRYRTAPGRYDEVAASYFLDEENDDIHFGDRVYRQEIPLAEPNRRPFLDRGFGPAVSEDGRKVVGLVGDEACVLMPLLKRPPLRVLLTGRAEQPGTLCELRVNGRGLGERPLEQRGWQTLEARIEPEQLARGMNRLCVRTRVPARGRDVAPRAIGTTGARAPVDLAVVSAGRSAGMRAELWVGGRRQGPDRRGLNVAAVDGTSGELLATDHFDLCYWPESGKLLATWLARWPRGTIVLAAVKDDASRRFDAAAREALGRIGAREDLSGRFRHTYAAIGVVGARPGSALEQIAKADPVVLVLGARPAEWERGPRFERLVLEVIRPPVTGKMILKPAAPPPPRK